MLYIALLLHRQTKGERKQKEKTMWIGDDGSYHDDFEGTYAHDVAGFDEETINDAFDGEPDAYWNID